MYMVHTMHKTQYTHKHTHIHDLDQVAKVGDRTLTVQIIDDESNEREKPVLGQVYRVRKCLFVWLMCVYVCLCMYVYLCI